MISYATFHRLNLSHKICSEVKSDYVSFAIFLLLLYFPPKELLSIQRLHEAL